jgi:type II secretory pathway pseudopilin PulG
MRPNRNSLRNAALRAFTIVEVLVALSAGVLVSMAAFLLSKNATTFFQHEARISSAQLALTLAMNRLTNDVQRAAFLSTPNIRTDPQVCRTSIATWTNGLKLLGSVNIEPSTQATPQSAQNGLFPDQIIIGGSMDSSEMFQVQAVISGDSGAPRLILRGPQQEPATMRTLASLAANENLYDKIKPIFYPNGNANSGRFAHIYHPETNWHWFGVIDYYIVNAQNAIEVQLKSTPDVPAKPATCGIGIGDTGGGWLFSVVSRVKYDIRSLATLPTSDPYYSLVQPQAAAATGDDKRTELVRVELDDAGNELPKTLEVVAEYAVDMRFGISVASLVTGDNYNPTVTSYPIGHSTVYSTAKDVGQNGTPQLIRSVQVRLATRTRAPDREADLPVGPDGRRLHFLISNTTRPTHARVRTNYANVALPNQGGFSLW